MLLLVKNIDGIIILLTLFYHILNNIYSKAMWTIMNKWTNLLFINKYCTYIFVVNTSFLVLLLFNDI